MSSPTLSPMQRQLTRVARRLFLQTFLVHLAWCWAGALLLAAAWFVAQPHLLPALSSEWRLGVAAGAGVAGTLLAVALAILRAPSRIMAALLLDEKFALKERVTTSLMLAPEHETSPVGKALLADTNARVDQLEVGSRFPVRLSWPAVLVPAGAAALALAAFYYQPPPTQAKPGSRDDLAQPAANPEEIEKKINKLKKPVLKQHEAAKPQSEELKRIEAELDQIARKPRENKEQLRERIKEMTALEESIKNREKELAEKDRSLKQQLQQMDRMAGQSDAQEGPAKELQKALSEGKMEEAKEELDRLGKKLKNNELSDKEKEQLAKQLQDIEKKLQQLSRKEEEEEKLKQLAKEGKLDAETLQRELDQLQKDSEKLKDLQELANQLGQCQKCLKKGDGKGAAEGLRGAAEKLQELDLQEDELKEIGEQLQRLQEAKESCCKGTCPGEQEGNGMGQGQKPGGRRPVGEDKGHNSFDAKGKTPFDAKGKKLFDGYAPGQNFKKKSSAEMAGDIKQAAQEAPEAIEQQRIPKSARDVAKGYFRNLGGQKEGEQKKE